MATAETRNGLSTPELAVRRVSNGIDAASRGARSRSVSPNPLAGGRLTPVRPVFRFTGRVEIKAVEAASLPERVSLPGGLVLASLDPYLEVAVDGYSVGQTVHRTKTFDPLWGDIIDSCVRDAESLEFTVFHKSTMPPDKFVASGNVSFEELIKVDTDDVWVSGVWIDRNHAFTTQHSWCCVVGLATQLTFWPIISSFVLSVLVDCASFRGLCEASRHSWPGVYTMYHCQTMPLTLLCR